MFQRKFKTTSFKLQQLLNLDEEGFLKDCLSQRCTTCGLR